VDLLQALRKEVAGNLTVRAALEEGRFRLALCGKPGQRREQSVLGDVCRTVARLKEAAQVGELVAGPSLLAELEACRLHVGPQRGTGRRLVEIPNEVAAPALPTVNLESLFTAEAESKLRVLMPPAVGERVEATDHALIGPGEIRPVVVAAFPLAVDYRDEPSQPPARASPCASASARSRAWRHAAPHNRAAPRQQIAVGTHSHRPTHRWRHRAF
jgi:hypothetical protein